MPASSAASRKARPASSASRLPSRTSRHAVCACTCFQLPLCASGQWRMKNSAAWRTETMSKIISPSPWTETFSLQRFSFMQDQRGRDAQGWLTNGVPIVIKLVSRLIVIPFLLPPRCSGSDLLFVPSGHSPASSMFGLQDQGCRRNLRSGKGFGTGPPRDGPYDHPIQNVADRIRLLSEKYPD